MDLKLADAPGSIRDSIRKAGLEEKFGGLSPGMSVQSVIDTWSHNKRQKERPEQ
jgi:hypothetical protein